MTELTISNLISAFLKYRRTTLISFLSFELFCLLSLVIPFITGINQMDENYQRECIARIDPAPYVQGFVDSITLNNYILGSITDPRIVFDSLSAAKVPEYAGVDLNAPDEKRTLSQISGILNYQNEYFGVEKETYGYKIKLKVNSDFDYNAFYSTMMDEAEKKLRNLFVPYAEDRIRGFENVTMKKYPDAADKSVFRHAFDRYVAAKEYMELSSPCLVMLNEPYFTETTTLKGNLIQSALRKAVILSVFALLFSVFLAFVHDYINRNRER